MTPHRVILCRVILMLASALPALPQTNPDMKTILERLDRIERENDSLRQDIRALREVLRAGVPPDTEERLSVQERRTAEQAQTKVESSQRFPLRITGMALLNTFINSKQNGGVDYPTVAFLGRGAATGGVCNSGTWLFQFRPFQDLPHNTVPSSTATALLRYRAGVAPRP